MRAPPLDPRWLPLIDTVARRTLGPFDRTGDALVHEIRQLSERYTRRGGALREASVERAARLRFFLPRDLPKIGGPIAELALASALPTDRPWRVLDVGAGLGTTSLGIAACARGLAAPPPCLEVLALEREAPLLDAMQALVAGLEAQPALGVPIRLRTSELDLERGALPNGSFDLIVLGLSLNELFEGASDALERRAHLCQRLLSRLEPGGALIVLEPALLETSRAVMTLRDALVAQGVRVFAPCPAGTERCPLLLRERDWCHEDLPLALPPPLAELAKKAGLRFEGLSYAYFTLRQGAALSEALGGAARVVGGPVKSKGRSELLVCHEGQQRRLNVLARDEDEALAHAQRGTLLALEVKESREVMRWGRDATGRVVRSLR